MRPAINQRVHYVARGSADGYFPSVCRAATVTEVMEDGDTVGLFVVNPTGFFFHALSDGGLAHHPGSLLGEDPVSIGATCGGRLYPGGTWHSPESVAE